MRNQLLGLLLLSVGLSGCGQGDLLTPAAPKAMFVEAQVVAPMSALAWLVSWSGTCAVHHPFDQDSESTCERQPFILQARCGGVPCTTEPAAALDPGIALDGSAFMLYVRPVETGTLTMTVTLEHTETHEMFVQVATVTVQ